MKPSFTENKICFGMVVDACKGTEKNVVKALFWMRMLKLLFLKAILD
ncbi:MAG: hypothetical protein L3J14_07780 [Flavobacteriaceae bacterium]|nr:hypothetical protein [Flavobacteriaceae bacterium]